MAGYGEHGVTIELNDDVASAASGSATFVTPNYFDVLAIIVVTVALVATWMPARRAAGVDPALVLRRDSCRTILERPRASGDRCDQARGSLSVKAEPTPGVLSATSVPCIPLARSRAIESPSPVPLVVRMSPRSTCTNGSKIFSS